MTDRHKERPVSFRPTGANREWLRELQAAGQSMGAVINEALDRLRAVSE